MSTERIVVCCRRKLFPVCSDWELFLLQHEKCTATKERRLRTYIRHIDKKAGKRREAPERKEDGGNKDPLG